MPRPPYSWGHAPTTAQPPRLQAVRMVLAASIFALVASVGAMIIAKGIANAAHFNVQHISGGIDQ